MQKGNSKFLVVVSIVAIGIAMLLSSCSSDSSQSYYSPSENGSNQTSGNVVPNTGTTQTTDVQKFSCSSGRTQDYELPWNPNGLQIVTDHGDIIIIGNEPGPTNKVNWFYNGQFVGKYDIGVIRYPIVLNKGSRVVMKLDGTTGNFNPDTQFYNFITVCSSWIVTTVGQPAI